jgi:hypothetical protein
MRRLLGLAASCLLVLVGLPLQPGEVAHAGEFGPALSSEILPSDGFDEFDFADPGLIEPSCDEPPCEPVQMVSAGDGGYVPITPSRAAELRSMVPGLVEVQIAGIENVPEDGLGAVVLNLFVSNVVDGTAVTVWPTGSPRPRVPNLVVDGTRDWATLALVGVGADGKISVHTKSGRVDLDIDVLGWFPEDELHLVTPQRIFDTVKHGPSGGLVSGGTVDVRVTDVAGIPSEAVAVVLRLESSSSRQSPGGITVWPTGEPRPDVANLIAEQATTRANLAVVAPGRGGSVSVHNARGRTHVAIEVLGWLSTDGAYRPVPATDLLDGAASLDAGATLDMEVEGKGGVPGAEGATGDSEGLAHAVVLDITVLDPANGTALTVAPFDDSGDEPPEVVNAAAGRGKDTSTLAMVKLGPGGKITLHNGGPPAQVRVAVVGWFRTPAVAVELTVPESVIVPESEQLLEVTPSAGSVRIELAPGAERPEIGSHVVLGPPPPTPAAQSMARTSGIDPDGPEPIEAEPIDTSEGYLGEVIDFGLDENDVLWLETEPALLEDVFPEGDIAVDLGASDYAEEVIYEIEQAPDGFTTLSATTQSTSGVKVNFEFGGESESECDLTGLTMNYGPYYDMNFRVQWKWRSAPVVTALATIGVGAEVALNELEASCGFDFKLMKASVTFMAGTVPVVVVFAVDASVDLKAGLSGLDLGAEADASITIGVRENQGFRSGTTTFTHTPLRDLLRPWDLEVWSMADVWMHFSVRLYSMVGPKISLGPFVEQFATMNPNRPLWALDAGFAAKIALSIDLWFKSWNWKLWEGEVPIADWMSAVLPDCTTYGPGLPRITDDWRPCRTPAPTARPDGSSRVFASRFRIVSAGVPLANLAIATTTLPGATVGAPYNHQLQASGLFSGDAVWTTTGLPSGLTLSPGGVLSGTPLAAGTHSFDVSVWYEQHNGKPVRPATPPTRTLTLQVDLGEPPPPAQCEVVVRDEAELRAALAAPPPASCDSTVVVLWTDTIDLTAGQLMVPEGASVTIDGSRMPGADHATFDADGESRVLYVAPGASVTLRDVHLVRGSAPSSAGGGAWVGPAAQLRLEAASEIRASTARYGGGVSVESADNSLSEDPPVLTLHDHSRIHSNTASEDGGGVYAFFATVELNDGTGIANNRSGGDGGGILAQGGTATLNSAVLLNNHAAGNGGGMMAQWGTATLNSAVLLGNSAGGGGGGILVQGGTATLNGAELLHNRAVESGGGIATGYSETGTTVTLNHGVVGSNEAGSFGGGVSTSRDQDSLILNGAMIAENLASGGGGGISARGALTLNDATIEDNAAFHGPGGGLFIENGSVELHGASSIVGNQAFSGPGGGLFIENGSVELHGASSIVGNYAFANGGGLFIENGSVELNDHSSISSNGALHNGAGIAISPGGTAVTVTLNHSSRINWNQVMVDGAGSGGGIYWPAGTVVLNDDSDVSGNWPQSFDPPWPP